MTKDRGGGWRQVPLDPVIRRWHDLANEPGLRAYQKDLRDGHLTCFVAKCCDPQFARPLWHMSISTRTNTHPPRPMKRLPGWYEIKEARYKFIPDKVVMALLLPPMDDYVNVHETTMQLWEIDRPGGPSASGLWVS